MLANRIINILNSLLTPITIPLQLVTTSVGGCLVALTFGLLLLPLSLVWMVLFMGPLLGMSWLWDRVWPLRIPLAVIGVPLAVLGAIYTSLVPSMGEMDARATKLLICWTWPFSLDFLHYQSNPDWRELGEERWERLHEVLAQNPGAHAMASRLSPYGDLGVISEPALRDEYGERSTQSTGSAGRKPFMDESEIQRLRTLGLTDEGIEAEARRRENDRHRS